MATKIISQKYSGDISGTYEILSYTVPEGYKFKLKNVIVGAEPYTPSGTVTVLGYAYLQINGVDYRGIQACGMDGVGVGVGIYGCSLKGGLGKDSLFTYGAGFTFQIPIPDNIEYPAGTVIKVMAEQTADITTLWRGTLIGIEEIPAGWRALQYVTEPPTAGWNKLKYAVEPPVAGAWNKLLYQGE